MPWEQIQMHMHELVDDEEMATWPLPPVLLTQVVRLVMKSGGEQMLQKVKELKVRARVLLGLGRMYLERGHHDCVGTTAALMHAETAAGGSSASVIGRMKMVARMVSTA